MREQLQIRDIILNMENQFLTQHVLEKTRKQGIANDTLVLDTLGELYELGKVKLTSDNFYIIEE